MGTVFVGMVMSLDGFVAGPNNDDDYTLKERAHAVA